MQRKTLILACLCAVALALPAGGIAATPTVVPFQGNDAGTFSLCGLNLTFTFHDSGVAVLKTSGVSLNAGEFTSVWTNPATGKSITIHGAQLGTTGAPVDNGDGTISFLQSGTGLYKVSGANGQQLSLQAGRFTTKITLDAQTGDLVSVEFLSVDGPHPTPADSNCDTIVAALT